MNKKLGKVAAIALSAAMISSAFAMSTSASFAAVPTYKGTATAVLTDADANKYLDTTASTAAGQITFTGTSANTAFSGATFEDSDAAAVTASTYDYTNVTIQNDGGSSVTLAQPVKGEYQFTPASAGKTKFKVSNLKIKTANDETYLVAPFDFTVDAENKDTYAEGIWYDSNSKPVTSAIVNDVLTVKERTITTPQSGTADGFATTADAAAATLPAQTVANARVDDSANTVTPTSAGTVTVSYESTKFANTYRNSDPLTVKAQSTYKNVTKVTKLTNGKYHVTFASGDPKDFDSLTGITLQADASGITVDKDVAADTIDGAGNAVTVNPGATVNKIAQTSGAVAIDGATVKTVSASGAAPVTVKASTAGDAANVDAITTAGTGTVGVGDAGDAATVNVGSITAGGKVTVDAGTKAYSKTTVKSIKADNVDVNSAKTSIGAIAANTTAGAVTVKAGADGVSLPALTGYALTTNADATVASLDTDQDVTLMGKTLTVTGTAKVKNINGAVDGTKAALAATTGTIKIGADKLTIAPEADSSTHLNNFKMVLTDSAAAYGKAFELSAGASADSNTAATDTTVGAKDLADINIAGATGYVANGGKTVTLGEKVDEAALNDASPAASKVDANHNVTVKAGTPITLAVEPNPLKTLPAGYYVQWTSKNGSTTPGYVTLGSTTGLSTTVTASYADVDTYKNTNTVTASLYQTGNATPIDSITYKVTAEKSAAAETTDFTATAPTIAIKTGTNTEKVTFAPNGSVALNTVTYVSSSNPLVATSVTSTDGKTATITASKAGSADLTFSWTNPTTGEVKTHVVTVYVADNPVFAYVNGRAVSPDDTLSFTQSTTVPITFVSADGTKIDTFNYNAGNGQIMSTRAPASTVWNGVSGAYGMYMNGPVGSVTGVYVNNQKICNVKVADRPFTCDTTCNFSMKAGKTYEFKLTPAAGTTFDNFTFNTAKDAALSTNGYKKNADGTINAFVKAVQKGTYGVYVTINGVQYKVFAVTVD